MYGGFNDMAIEVVARNIILLLVAMEFEPEETVPVMIHSWYSVLMPKSLVEKIAKVLWPLIHCALDKDSNDPEPSIVHKAARNEKVEMHLKLKRKEWKVLSAFIHVPDELTRQHAEEIRRSAVKDPLRVDHADIRYYSVRPSVHEAITQYREDGLLLPYGGPRGAFDSSNPTFFYRNNCDLDITAPEFEKFWPFRDADPLQGWMYEDRAYETEPVCHSNFLTERNDVYGEIFFYVRKVLMQFCKRLQTGKVSFQALNVDAKTLDVSSTNERIRFDRIETSNIADQNYIGYTAAIKTFVPLLKDKLENPHATLLLFFTTAVNDNRMFGDLSATEQLSVDNFFSHRRDQVQAFGTLPPRIHPEFRFRLRWSNHVVDYDTYFEDFAVRNGLATIARTMKAQLKDSHIHSIVPRSPYRIPTYAEFEAQRPEMQLMLCLRCIEVELQKSKRQKENERKRAQGKRRREERRAKKEEEGKPSMSTEHRASMSQVE
jgi:hypothetical protein